MIAGELDRSVREIERKISVSVTITSRLEDNADIWTGHAYSGGVLAFCDESENKDRLHQ